MAVVGAILQPLANGGCLCTGQYKALEQLLQPQVLPLLGQCHGLVPVLAQEEKHQLLQHLLPHVRLTV